MILLILFNIFFTGLHALLSKLFDRLDTSQGLCLTNSELLIGVAAVVLMVINQLTQNKYNLRDWIRSKYPYMLEYFFWNYIGGRLKSTDY
jgi:hypothetical protein